MQITLNLLTNQQVFVKEPERRGASAVLMTTSETTATVKIVWCFDFGPSKNQLKLIFHNIVLDLWTVVLLWPCPFRKLLGPRHERGTVRSLLWCLLWRCDLWGDGRTTQTLVFANHSLSATGQKHLMSHVLYWSGRFYCGCFWELPATGCG